MARTRSAILAAAALCVERVGVRRTTMSEVADSARVAKATLYNHFRTKDDLLDALVLSEIEALQARVLGSDLATSLATAATAIRGLAALRTIVADEPAILAGLARPGDGRAWTVARTAVSSMLDAADVAAAPATIELVLRWLCGYLLQAGEVADIEFEAQVLAAGLATIPAPLPLRPEAASVITSGVGWI